jgi:hypothetical protein
MVYKIKKDKQLIPVKETQHISLPNEFTDFVTKQTICNAKPYLSEDNTSILASLLIKSKYFIML